MFEFISTLPTTVSAYPDIAYLVVFLLATSESIPFIGVVVPGTAVIVGIAALIPRGDVMLWPLLLAASLGAILGDGVPFWIGHRCQSEILQHWPLCRYPNMTNRSRAFFERHGGKSVFLARFVPGVRAFIPLTAGILRMPTKRFYMSNVSSALIWAPIHIVPGFLAGKYAHLISGDTYILVFMALSVLFFAWITMHMSSYTGGRGAIRGGMNETPSCPDALAHSPPDEVRRWRRG